RRHTRFSRDWSSDVCSSDLVDSAGVHQDEAAPLPLALGVDPVARHSRLAFDDGQPAAGDAVEEGRLSYVRTSDDGDDSFGHGDTPSALRQSGGVQSTPPPSAVLFGTLARVSSHARAGSFRLTSSTRRTRRGKALAVPYAAKGRPSATQPSRRKRKPPTRMMRFTSASVSTKRISSGEPPAKAKPLLRARSATSRAAPR